MIFSSAYMVILHAYANSIFQSFWIWNSLDPDQVLFFVMQFGWAWSGPLNGLNSYTDTVF